MSIYSAYEFRQPITRAKAHDFNVHYAVGKWWLGRVKLAEVVASEGWRSEVAEEQRATVEYWRKFCEEEFGLALK
jgi:hypothetical protein